MKNDPLDLFVVSMILALFLGGIVLAYKVGGLETHVKWLEQKIEAIQK